MNKISYALFNVEQLNIVSESQKSEKDQLRPLDDKAVEVLSRDMARYGFDHSKQGELLISVLSHHLDMFTPVTSNELQSQLQTVLNLSKEMMANMKSLHKFEGNEDALKEMIFTDGRHRHKVVRMAYPGTKTFLLCKILVNVSQKEGRILSYNASREAQGVAPCFLDAISCLFNEETSGFDDKEIENVAIRLGCEDHFKSLFALHETLYKETRGFVQGWRTTGLFSISNISMKKNKNLMRLLSSSHTFGLFGRGRGRPNVLGNYFRGNAIKESDLAIYQVLIFALVITVFQLSESESGANFQIGDVISKSCNAFVVQLDNLIPASECRRVLQQTTSRELLRFFWKATILSIEHLHNVSESASHRNLQEVLQSSKGPTVPEISLKELNEAEDFFAELKTRTKKRKITAKNKDIPRIENLDTQIVETAQDNTTVQRELQEINPVEIHGKTDKEDPEALESASIEQGIVEGAAFESGKDMGPKNKSPSSEDGYKKNPEDPDRTSVQEATARTLEKSAVDDSIQKANTGTSEGIAADGDEEMDFKDQSSMESPIPITSSSEDTDDDALNIVRKTDKHIKKHSLQTQKPEKMADVEDSASPDVESDVVFVDLPTVQKPKKASKGHMDRTQRKIRRSGRKSNSVKLSSTDEYQSQDEEGTKSSEDKVLRKRNRKDMLSERDVPTAKRHKGNKTVEKKVACALSCFNMAEDLVESIEIVQVQPRGDILMPTLSRCSSLATKWAVFANSVDCLFDQSILQKRSLVSLLEEFELNKYNIKDVFVLSPNYIEDLPDHLGGKQLRIASQKVFLSKEWNSKISDIPSKTKGHFIHYKKKLGRDTPEITCVRIAKNLQSEDFKAYIETALDTLKGLYGFIDALDQQTELVEAVIALQEPRQIRKLNEFSHSGKKSSCTYIYNTLRKHVLETCNCGGHAIMDEGNHSAFNMHPMKDVKLCEGVSKPFQMILREEDEFFDVAPVSHYSVYLHGSNDISGWSCDMTHMEDGTRLQQGGFISYKDYQKCMKSDEEKVKLVAGKSYIVDCESGMRDHKARLSPFHLPAHFISGLFEKEWHLFFDDESMASKFNQHHIANVVEYGNQLTEEALRAIFEQGLGQMRKSHVIIPMLNIPALKALDRKSTGWVQCKKCKALELFVNYGENYVF